MVEKILCSSRDTRWWFLLKAADNSGEEAMRTVATVKVSMRKRCYFQIETKHCDTEREVKNYSTIDLLLSSLPRPLDLNVPRMSLLVPLRQLGECGTWGLVAGELGEDVELDARVGRFVKARGWYATAQLSRSTALNLEVDTLRVRLSAVDLTCSMESNDLVADHIVAWCKVGDGEVPLLIVHQQELQ
jgi:hypothetical protein